MNMNVTIGEIRGRCNACGSIDFLADDDRAGPVQILKCCGCGTLIKRVQLTEQIVAEVLRRAEQTVAESQRILSKMQR
jgi:hypothetical protein